MLDALFNLMLAASALGLLILAVQHLALRRHLRTPAPRVLHRPVDQRAQAALRRRRRARSQPSRRSRRSGSPDCEVLLGARTRSDPAWPIACDAVRRWPHSFRVVLQRGVPGLNPRVNQLVTLLEAARHDLFVISDSNVRVRPDYLDGIAAALADPTVRLVTHFRMAVVRASHAQRALTARRTVCCRIVNVRMDSTRPQL